MKKNMVFITVASVLLCACNSSPKQQTNPSNPVEQKNKAISLTLDTVDFSSDTAGAKVKVECLMLERLTTAILKSSQRYPLVVKEKIAGVDHTEFVLKATYTNVNAHRWVFPSLRPSSSATVKAEILKNDQVVATISKEIGSGAAFGACDRLEKIALAGGRYISKWAAKQNYN